MYGRSQLLRLMFTPEAASAPASVEIALTRFVAPANATAAQLIEPDVGDYARQPYGIGLVHWAPTGFGELYNTTKITWPQLSASWGLITGWAVIEPVSGQCLNAGALQEPIATVIGMVPFVDPGALILGLED